jgi:hypothetical protein
LPDSPASPPLRRKVTTAMRRSTAPGSGPPRARRDLARAEPPNAPNKKRTGIVAGRWRPARPRLPTSSMQRSGSVSARLAERVAPDTRDEASAALVLQQRVG